MSSAQHTAALAGAQREVADARRRLEPLWGREIDRDEVIGALLHAVEAQGRALGELLRVVTEMQP